MRGRLKVAAAATATAGLTLPAGPAVADHDFSPGPPSGSVCYAGELASGTGLRLVGKTAKRQVQKDGALRFTCVFHGLPESTTAEKNGYVDWQRPDEARRWANECIVLEGGDTLSGAGTALHTPGATAEFTCMVPSVPAA